MFFYLWIVNLKKKSFWPMDSELQIKTFHFGQWILRYKKYYFGQWILSYQKNNIILPNGFQVMNKNHFNMAHWFWVNRKKLTTKMCLWKPVIAVNCEMCKIANKVKSPLSTVPLDTQELVICAKMPCEMCKTSHKVKSAQVANQTNQF